MAPLPATTATFIRLSSLIDMSETDKLVVERFVCVMYDRGSTFTNANDCRRYLFTKMSRSIENCPPTSNVLENHVKRAQLQSSIWTSALISDSESIDPLKWGWQKKETDILSLCGPSYRRSQMSAWSSKDVNAKKCTSSCTCHKNGLSCTELCLQWPM